MRSHYLNRLCPLDDTHKKGPLGHMPNAGSDVCVPSSIQLKSLMAFFTLKGVTDKNISSDGPLEKKTADAGG